MNKIFPSFNILEKCHCQFSPPSSLFPRRGRNCARRHGNDRFGEKKQLDSCAALICMAKQKAPQVVDEKELLFDECTLSRVFHQRSPEGHCCCNRERQRRARKTPSRLFPIFRGFSLVLPKPGESFQSRYVAVRGVICEATGKATSIEFRSSPRDPGKGENDGNSVGARAAENKSNEGARILEILENEPGK